MYEAIPVSIKIDAGRTASGEYSAALPDGLLSKFDVTDVKPRVDGKIALAAAKPNLALVPMQSLIGPARVYGYGAKKYAPGNFHGAALSDGAGARYVGAALRHLQEMQLPNGLHTPESLASLDAESGLPHIDHTICGLLMLRAIMTKCGALPADPGVGNEPPKVGPTNG